MYANWVHWVQLHHLLVPLQFAPSVLKVPTYRQGHCRQEGRRGHNPCTFENRRGDPKKVGYFSIFFLKNIFLHF